MAVVITHFYTSYHTSYHRIHPFEYFLFNLFHLPQSGYLLSSIHPLLAYLNRELFLPPQE